MEIRLGDTEDNRCAQEGFNGRNRISKDYKIDKERSWIGRDVRFL